MKWLKGGDYRGLRESIRAQLAAVRGIHNILFTYKGVGGILVISTLLIPLLKSLLDTNTVT